MHVLFRATVVARVLVMLVIVGGVAGVAQVQAQEQSEPLGAAAVATLVEQRALAQHGLSVGLLVSLARSDFALGLVGNVNKCLPVPGNHTAKVLKSSLTSTAQTTTIELYYDSTSCTHRFMRANVKITKRSATVFKTSVNGTLYSTAGKALGTLALTGSATKVAGGKAQMSQVGTIAHPGKAASHVGFTCTVPNNNNKNVTIPCQIGVAQTLPGAGGDIASLTKLNINIKAHTSAGTLTGITGQLFRASAGKLKVVAPTNKTIAISGGATKIGSVKGDGTLGSYSMLPSNSEWELADAGNKAIFTMNSPKIGAAFGGMVGTFPPVKARALVKVDRGGNGTITYSNKVKASVIGWLLAN